MSTYESAADRARRLLRAAGYSQRLVTARLDHSTLRVTIRDGAVSLAKVRAIVGDLENVRRDERTGEILSGGNTFLDVAYHNEVIAPHLAAARDKLASVEAGYAVRIGFHAAHRSASSSAPWDVIVRTSTSLESGQKVCAHGIDHGLKQIVVDNLSRGAYRGEAIPGSSEEIEIDVAA